MQSLRFILCAIGVLLLGAGSALRADGWDSISIEEMVSRSRFVGVGTLSIDGRTDDGWLKAKLTFTQTIYSGIGQVKSYDVRVAPKTVAGVTQNWPSGKKGIWFILKSGDKYEPINHPGCWMDEQQAKAVADQACTAANKAYDEAKKAAKEANKSSSSSTTDGSDSEKSVAAYAAMVAAADSARHVPFQDPTKQSQQFFDHVTAMLDTAGVRPPFAGDLSDPGKQNQFFDQAKKMLGPAGAGLGDLPGPSDPSRAGRLADAQNNVGNILLEMIRGTMASPNPAESMQKMVPVPGGNTPPGPGTAGGPPGPPGGKPGGAPMPQGTRKQMLGALVNGHAGGAPAGPKPGPGAGPRPGPR